MSNAQFETYFAKLMTQGTDNLNICPTFFAAGKRKKLCSCPVLLSPESVIVCCYLGDKHEITEKEFVKKVAEMKATE